MSKILLAALLASGDARVDISVNVSHKSLRRGEMDADVRRIHAGVLYALLKYPRYVRFFLSEIKTKNL